MDISDSVFLLADVARDLPNLHLIQCDLRRSPLREGMADRVYSSGVLHHVMAPEIGIEALWRLLGERGKLYFWVYSADRFCIYDKLRRLLISPFTFPRSVRISLAWVLAPVLWSYFVFTKNYSYKDSLESLRTVAFRIFDNISPEYQHRVSRNQLQSWCRGIGIEQYRIVEELGVLCSR
jgi:SAM-dependent methyltransferase